MRTRIIQIIPLLLVLLALGFRYFSNWCIDVLAYCYGTWLHQIAFIFTNPLFLFTLFCLPTVLMLTLVPFKVFQSWFKFAAWALPLTILYIATTPVFDNTFIPFERGDAARLAGGIFTLASLALITWKYISLRRGK